MGTKLGEAWSSSPSGRLSLLHCGRVLIHLSSHPQHLSGGQHISWRTQSLLSDLLLLALVPTNPSTPSSYRDLSPINTHHCCWKLVNNFCLHSSLPSCFYALDAFWSRKCEQLLVPEKHNCKKTQKTKNKHNMPLQMVYFLLGVSLIAHSSVFFQNTSTQALSEMTFQLIDFLLCTSIYFMNLYNYHLTQALQNNYCTVCSSPTKLYIGYYPLNSQYLSLCQAKSRHGENAGELSEFFQRSKRK